MPANEQQGLGLVAPMVGGAYGHSAFLLPQLFEPGVAQTACGHFQALAVAARLGGGVEVTHAQGDVQPTAKVAHELLVAVALAAAQMEVAVGGHDVVFGFAHLQQQAHAVGAAA